MWVLACVGHKVKGAICICEGLMSNGLQQEVAAANQALHFILLLQDQSQLLLQAEAASMDKMCLYVQEAEAKAEVRGRGKRQKQRAQAEAEGQGSKTCNHKEDVNTENRGT